MCPNLVGSRSRRHGGKFIWDLSNVCYGIKQHFGTQTLPIVTRIILSISDISFCSCRAKFVHMRFCNRGNQLFDVIVIVGKVFSEALKQRFIRCRICRSQVIHWFKQAASHEICPNPVYHDAGKEFIVFGDHPIN